ncbi:MAG: hypothetical protein M1822_009596 [Bathelium mastoideum]|nr:MAG: hypothetical protein M1822_009596 [Bathelium mastoideum]
MSTTWLQPSRSVIDSLSALSRLLDFLTDLPIDPPPLYFDLEGIKLGRLGSISFVSLHAKKAFTTSSSQRECSLKTVLESKKIPKVFFDVRNDSDALHSHYDISVNGVIDLQLLELATRKGSKEFVAGLAKCIRNDSPVSAALKTAWRETKDTVSCLYDPKRGGRYEVFNERPVRQDLVQYCASDVELLPTLWEAYGARLRMPGKGCWRSMIRKQTQKRIELSQSPSYDGQAKDKVRGPWDSHSIEKEMENWNDDVMLLGIQDGMVLNEEDEWVDPPQRNAEKSSVFTMAACIQ